MFTHLQNQPFVIAGPCSVESRQQLADATAALAAIPQVRLIRAGVWKPRSRPSGFEGLGEPALVWMKQLADQYGTQYCCEVARPEHVALCLQYGISTVWIGARTTANPFMVEEICHALRGTDTAVLVKNPVCPDIRLWIGAIERIQHAGIKHIAAVHRGFNMFDNHGYRNAPLWEVPLALRHERPDIPVLCDPSHIGGHADLVPSLAHTAMLLNYHGLMIETHPDPQHAWTDTAQQLTPQQLLLLLKKLPSPSDNPTQRNPDLEQLRHQIDTLDHDLLHCLNQRMHISRSIAALKKQLQMSVYQPSRWEHILDDRLQLARSLGLDPEFVKELLEKIHAESVRIQMENNN